MLRRSRTTHQSNLFGIDLLSQLGLNDPLLKLAPAIPWDDFDEAFSIHCTQSVGAPVLVCRDRSGCTSDYVLEKMMPDTSVLH